jgi:Uma2 family endonuclease
VAAGGRLWHADGMSHAPHPDAGTDEPRAPTSEVWATLTDEQRQRVRATLVPIPRSQMPPVGDPHINAERIAESSLGGWFRRRGRRAYIGRGITVYYPGERRFAPDFFVVFDVPEGERITWVVDHEGRGLDFALEILFDGDRKKDLERNVEWFARLGIPEYFVFDARRVSLHGYRLGDRPGVYTPIIPQGGRWRAPHLGAELGLQNGRLRFYLDGALLPIADEIEAALEDALNEALLRAEEQARQTAQAQARAEEEARRAAAVQARADALESEVEALRAELARLKG